MPRGRGRPPKRYIPRGRAAALRRTLEHRVASLPSVSTTSLSVTLPPEDLDGGVLVPLDDLFALELATEDFDAVVERPTKIQSPFLDRIDPVQRNWTLIDQIPVWQCTQWFDAQFNDYNKNKDDHGTAVDIIWLDHPGDAPRDIRARRFTVEWSPNGELLHPDLLEAARRDCRPVARWRYYCAGVHDILVDDIDESDLDEGSSAPSDDRGGSVSPIDGHTRSRWGKCSGRVILRFEVCANNLKMVNIWQQGNHTAALPEQGLQWSRYLRNRVLERLHWAGAKVSHVLLELVRQYCDPQSDSLQTRRTKDPLPCVYEFPAHRRPKERQVHQMMPAVRLRQRLHRNPFLAIHLLYQRNQDSMYYYTPHDFTRPDSLSNFTVALGDVHSLDSLILNSASRGVAMDSSWRNKNENRAAMTMLCTVNEKSHVVPGAVLLSANIQTDTLHGYIVETRHRIIERAHNIIRDPSSIICRSAQDSEAILESAKHIVNSGKWTVSHWMIDKCLNQLHAIRTADPDVYIRLCQFHVIQAILQWDCDSGKEHQNDEAVPRIGFELKYQILILFRALQRCRLKEDWPRASSAFLEGIKELIMNQPDRLRTSMKSGNLRTAQWQFVRLYFERNWFIDDWIPLFTDIGLSPDQTRDGTLNTNNWIESQFRTFDLVFLDSHQNKRIDRLGTIILHDFFQFYRYCEPTDRAASKELVEMNNRAHYIWDHDLVKCDRPGVYTVRQPR
ncbi:hypothetical protein NEOLEDRAFT_1215062 [Neolentinus lepideus HHB14362 ss-1]|uniref:Uncharacterized protein n=1 Tax=Neolentinus lepideus HHB14362 ss-1 TaxID=1314782 RepID=A0A165VAD1_9AGAM|nr:hypothetical protein NEOLEDRAFT_1215062 [Neolentinus lepideus HHB14362 ss-1]